MSSQSVRQMAAVLQLSATFSRLSSVSAVSGKLLGILAHQLAFTNLAFNHGVFNDHILPRHAMRKRGPRCRPLSVSLSVRHTRKMYPNRPS